MSSKALVPQVIKPKKLNAALEKFKWEKGKPSPNPHGRPKGSGVLLPLLTKKLESHVPKDPQKRKYKQKIIDALVENAANGNLNAAKEVLDRAEGKVGGSSGIAGGDLTINLGLIQAKEIFKE